MKSASLVVTLKCAIDGDRYFLSPRVMTLKSILGRLEPPKPAPASKAPAAYATASKIRQSFAHPLAPKVGICTNLVKSCAGSKGMRGVRLKLEQARFSAEMAEMRRWLDHYQYEPTRFDCYQQDDEILVCVEFRREDVAAAFAGRFDGEIKTSSAFASPQRIADDENTDRKRQRWRSNSRYPRQERRSG